MLAMTIATLGLKVDAGEIAQSIHTLTDLANAAERASKALDELAGKSHGGIVIRVAGSLAHVEIKPKG